MIGDNNQLKSAYVQTALEIYHAIGELIKSSSSKLVIGIAGESGSGKTITSLALKEVLEAEGKPTQIVHMDDFFHLPPASNHAARVANISQVGPQEVNLDLLENLIIDFKANQSTIHQPLVNYTMNTIYSKKWNAQNYEVLIVEGTYTLFLENLNVRLFIDRNYNETKEDRLARGRDIANDFVEQVLAIEHKIIQQQKRNCDLRILADFTVTKTN